MAQPTQTIPDLIEPYLRGRVRAHEIIPLTARNDRCILRHFAGVCGPVAPGSLNRRHIRRWIEALEPFAPATRRRRWSTVKGFLGWLVVEGHLAKHPLAGTRGPKQPRSVPRAMTAAAVARVLLACPDVRARLIVTLMVQCALRCCEVSALELGDIDRSRSILRIRGKGGHERLLPLLLEVDQALAAYLAEYPASAGPLVRSYRQPQRSLDPDTISGLVSRIMWAAGVKRARRDGVSAHALRHTAATDMLRQDAHLRDVQQALGHAHLSTTEVYMPYVVRSLEDAMGGRWYGGPPEAA